MTLTLEFLERLATRMANLDMNGYLLLFCFFGVVAIQLLRYKVR